jgi:hypothetical protein
MFSIKCVAVNGKHLEELPSLVYRANLISMNMSLNMDLRPTLFELGGKLLDVRTNNPSSSHEIRARLGMTLRITLILQNKSHRTWGLNFEYN